MRFFQWLKKDAGEPSFGVPDGERVYVVGDIHGRADLLTELAQKIAADLTSAPAGEAITLFLGDYIDRGPASREVLARLSSGDFPTKLVGLRGNHELMLLDFLQNPQTGANWRQNGGLETLHSYDVDLGNLRAGLFRQVAQDLEEAMPSAHLAFIRKTQWSLTIGDYFFCHAGVRPGVPLRSQKEDDLLWIREPFLSSKSSFGKMVVHGHTPVTEPDVRPNRINLDTGAYITGKLTCLVLEGDQRRFLVTGG